MKLRIRECDKPWNKGQYKVEKYSWMWGWEDYDGRKFPTYEQALEHAIISKTLNG